MNYKTFYEFTIFDSWMENFVIIGLFLIAYSLFKYIKTDDENENDDSFRNKNLGKYGFSFLCIIMGLIFLITEKYDLIKTKNVYHNSKYLLVEGYVTNYEAASHEKSPDTFIINNIVFKLGFNGFGYHGYKKMQRNDGMIRNGMYLRLKYSKEEDNNRILKIEQRIDKP